MSNVKYSLKKKAVNVDIEQEDGSIRTYEIRRASGTEIESYLDENSDRLETVQDQTGKVQVKQIKTYKEIYVSLLKHCLYLDEKKVPSNEIAAFPYDVQRGLFEEAQTVNGLNEAGLEQVKN